VKTIQSRKEALESFRQMTEAREARQADQRRQLSSKRLNLNKVTLEDFETVLPNLPKPTLAQILQARTVKPSDSWKAVSQVHGVGEKVLQNLKVYVDTPAIDYPVQEKTNL
jgi:DNA uptake protein ComE-like DNA-binding protein